MSTIKLDSIETESPRPSPHPQRRPDWIKVSPPKGETYRNLKRLMRTKELHTFCEEAPPYWLWPVSNRATSG